MISLQLFWSFFQVGLFSIGGGYAALPLIQEQVVDIHHWLTTSSFTDLITISQMTPGPIAINSATFVGTQIAGLPGALLATLGCVLPSCIIVLILAVLYQKYHELTVIQDVLFGLRPAIVALIASAGVTIFISALWGTQAIGLSTLDLFATGIFLAALCVLRMKKPNPVFVMLGSGVLGLLSLLF